MHKRSLSKKDKAGSPHGGEKRVSQSGRCEAIISQDGAGIARTTL